MMADTDFPLSPADDESQITTVLRHGSRWLRFPEPLEQQFRDDHHAAAHTRVRISLIVAFITTAGFFFIDHWILNSKNAAPDLVRFGLQLPILLAVLFSTSRRFYVRWFEIASYIGLPLFGLGTLVMVINSSVDRMPLVASRLLLVSFYCYFMIAMRLRPALVCNALLLLGLIAAGALGAIPFDICTYMAFALLCANIFGSVGAYALEYASRIAFLERMQLQEMAARDGLTRLLNRQTFEYRARKLWRAATTLGRQVAVIMIDVDYFKRYNDHYGHQSGDECLRRIASAIRDAVNPGGEELVARYGGEELIVLLIDRNESEVEEVARDIVAIVEGQKIPHAASMAGSYVSVSVGACKPTRDSIFTFSELANIADHALYAAKHKGRNRYFVLDARDGVEQSSSRLGEAGARPEVRAIISPAPG